MLSSAEQGLLRIMAGHALIDTCDIVRVTRTQDDGGGWTETTVTIAYNVKCRLSPVKNDFEQERIMSGIIGAEITWILSLPVGTDIRLTDRVVKGGFTFEVAAILTAPRSITTVIRTVVRETK